jgi:hypothetical protein
MPVLILTSYSTLMKSSTGIFLESIHKPYSFIVIDEYIILFLTLTPPLQSLLFFRVQLNMFSTKLQTWYHILGKGNNK